jgi:hypothetical protein
MPFPFHIDGRRPLQANLILIDATTRTFDRFRISSPTNRQVCREVRSFFHLNLERSCALVARTARPPRDQTLNYFCQRRPGFKRQQKRRGCCFSERPLTRMLTAYSRPLFINVAVSGQSRSASAVRATSLCLVRRNCKDGQRFHAPLAVKRTESKRGEQSSFNESQNGIIFSDG